MIVTEQLAKKHTPSHDDIKMARDRLFEVRSPVKPTDLEYSEELSRRYGPRVYLASEIDQCTNAYKIRGAYNWFAVQAETKSLGHVVAASAGNHSSAVAYCAQAFDRKCTIFMPTDTPEIKIQKTRLLGKHTVEVVLHGATVSESLVTALTCADNSRSAFIHPFDDPLVVAGQGTLGLEIADILPESPAAVFCPVGGGGLLSGVKIALDEIYPEVQYIAAEPSGAASLTACKNAGTPIELNAVDGFVDGASVSRVGNIASRVLSDESVRTDTPTNVETQSSLEELWELGYKVERAAALSLAALKRQHMQWQDKPVVLILSGGNYAKSS